MRPGPGLVVMALAFISGARRGTSQQQSSPSQGGKLGKGGDDGTGTFLRVNPWLSACDLAQPNSADLQGQCSAGTLPVAWVDEGPGPPRCPPACETLRFHENYNKNNYDNKIMNMENRLNEKQQCLDYMGDNEESSPAQICKKSPRDIETKLRSLRLRHCCERNAISALHDEALVAVLNGGAECMRTLNDLLETDALATRITCEFTEILVRYDCRQPFSIINHCEDCKEAYRRWVCSTLIPFFAEIDDIRPNSSVNETMANSSISTATINIKNSANANSRSSRSTNSDGKMGTDNNSLTEVLKRSRRKPKTSTIRKRIRPCLGVCQTVEQKCPYMLPGDRAPAHPTQYAGEPTFLCLDPNIPETGEQFYKSNNGPDNCCYRYCGSPIDGICSKCNLTTTTTTTISPSSSSTTTTTPSSITTTTIRDSNVINDKNSNINYNYDEIPQQSLTCQSTTSPPKPNCPIPYYVSSSAAASPSSSLIMTTTRTTTTTIIPRTTMTMTTTTTTTTPTSTAASTATTRLKRRTTTTITTITSRITTAFNSQLPWTISWILLANVVAATWTNVLLQLAGS